MAVLWDGKKGCKIFVKVDWRGRELDKKEKEVSRGIAPAYFQPLEFRNTPKYNKSKSHQICLLKNSFCERPVVFGHKDPLDNQMTVVSTVITLTRNR